MAAKIFHPLLALIASASNNELAKYGLAHVLRARNVARIVTRK